VSGNFQIAIVLKTPPFRTQNIKQPVKVFVYLQSPQYNERSDPKPFQYVPENPGKNWWSLPFLSTLNSSQLRLTRFNCKMLIKQFALDFCSVIFYFFYSMIVFICLSNWAGQCRTASDLPCNHVLMANETWCNAQCYPPSVWTEDKTAKLLFSVRNPNPKSKPNPNHNTNLYYNPNPDPKPNPSPKFLIP